MESLSGRPITLTDEVKQQILDAIPKVLAIDQIAGLCRLSPRSLRRWISRGKNELEQDKDTIFTQLWLDYNHKRAEVAHELIRNMKWYYRVNTWLLERTYKKDYGANDDQKKFYEAIASKLAKAGIKLDSYESFVEDLELDTE